MPAWPKSLFVFGVNLLSAAAELNLLQRGGAAALQARAFKRLTRRLAGTRHWRAAGIEPGIKYETFRARVPPSTHARLAPLIGRMARGETDLLWPGRCQLFALTAGTIGPQQNYVPVTDEMLVHYRRAEFESLLCYTVRVRHAAVFRGKHVTLGGVTAVTAIPGAEANAARTGDISAITALHLAPWAERHLFEPGEGISQMTDWEMKLAAIVKRTRGLDVRLLNGLPNWTLHFADVARATLDRPGPRLPHLQELWPHLECFVHHGIPIGPYYDELRAALGPTVNFHEVYAATEGCLAVQDATNREGLRVLVNAGLFFEFIPVADYDESRLEQLGPKAVPLAGVRKDVDYAVLLTTPAGLARYALGDVVRFVSRAPPRVHYVGRTQLALNAFDERLTEKHLTDALVMVCQRENWRVVNFHVAPLVASSLTGQVRGRHEWWLELKPGTVTTPTGPQIAAGIDSELERLSPDYAARRHTGSIDAPVVRLVMPGVFEHWLSFRRKWGGLNKVQRCRSDRLIADELAGITQFARD